MANNVNVKDAAGTNQTFNTLYDAVSNTHRSHVVDHPQIANADVSTSNPMPTNLIDGISTNKATVATFHSTDNQQPGGTAFGLLTGGVAQLLNPLGNLDRQRETGNDNIPAQGIATGTAQLSSPLLSTTVSSGAITGNATVGNTQFVNCTTSFTQRANIVQTFSNGTVLLADAAGANAEYIFVTTANATGVNAQFTKSHGASITLTGFSYSQARDSAGTDGQTPIGMPSGTLWMWNGAINGGVGGVEIERSAAGELDGASGNGTNVAAEYEWNAGGPANSSGKATGFQFDRARNVQGKANVSFTITTSTAGMANITFTAAANTNLLQPGQKVTLSGNNASGPESVVVSAMFVPGSGNSALLQSPIVNPGQTTAQWDIYATIGPGLTGFYPDGLGIEEETVYDPVTKLFYIERSATQDNTAPQNIVIENPGLLNANGGIDRQRNNIDPFGANTITATASNTQLVSADQTNFNHRGITVYINITSTTGTAVNTSVQIQVKDPIAGQYFNIGSVSAPAITGSGANTQIIQLYPGLINNSAVSYTTVNAVLPRTFRILMSNQNALGNTVTGSVNYSLIL